MSGRRLLPWLAPLLLCGALAWVVLPRASRTVSGAPPAVPYDAAGRALRPVTKPAAPPNLVLIVVDTLRADGHEGGPTKATMPYLASLAAEGISFSDAIASAPWTMPSLASLLTGLLPSAHGLNDARLAPALSEAVPTFAEVLASTYGYETAAFTDSTWFGGTAGVLQGFAASTDGFTLQGTGQYLGVWARGRDPKRPFFLLLHTLDAHDPYGAKGHRFPDRPWERTPELADRAAALKEPWELTRAFLLDGELRSELNAIHGNELVRTVVRWINDGVTKDPRPELVAELRTAYVDGLRWVDGLLERSVGYLDRMGLLENTVLVVTADHGEAFAEHGIVGHGRQLYDELVRIPLVIRGPAPFRGGRVVEGTVGLIDVLPTFFDHAGLALPEGIHGRSVLPALAEGASGRPIVSEEVLSEESTGRRGEGALASVRDESWKYVVNLDRTTGTLREEWYDLVADPGERHDLGSPPPADRRPASEAFCRAVEEVRARVRALAEPKPDGAADPAVAPCR